MFLTHPQVSLKSTCEPVGQCCRTISTSNICSTSTFLWPCNHSLHTSRVKEGTHSEAVALTLKKCLLRWSWIADGQLGPIRLHWSDVYGHRVPVSSLSTDLLLRLSPYLDSQPLFKEVLLCTPPVPAEPAADFLTTVTRATMSFSPSF